MATYNNLPDLFGAIADSIRGKTGGSADIVADNFPTEIANIPTGVEVIKRDAIVVNSGLIRIVAYEGEDFTDYNCVQVALLKFPTNASTTMQESDIIAAVYRNGKVEYSAYSHGGGSNIPATPLYSASKIELPPPTNYTWTIASGKIYGCVCWKE